MKIIYDSMTGNVERFVKKQDVYPHEKLKEGLLISEPFILVTYTFEFGNVPNTTDEFLKFNHRFLKGVASSGNRNWGSYFALAADKISSQYNVPIIHKFELSGTKKDVDLFLQGVENIVGYNDVQLD